MDIWDTTILEKPNWNDHIQKFFSLDPDVDCMARQGIDLTTYFGVRLNADKIYFHTKRGSMPPQTDRRWSDTKVENFYNWMWAGYPEGEADFQLLGLEKHTPPRVRRSIEEYEDDTVYPVQHHVDRIA